MTEKEKAKAYYKTIERAKKLYSNGIAEEVFSELKESEDEWIEKACDWLREQKEMIGISFQEDFIERFKMAMKK